MIVLYYTMTGNVERFIKKSEIDGILLNKDLIINEKFILVTGTTGFGEIPNDVASFLVNNKKFIVGVIGSGNKNWGNLYCNAAKLIAKEYNVENILNFELAGNSHDIDKFNKIMREIN